MSRRARLTALPLRALVLSIVPASFCLSSPALAETEAGGSVSASGSITTNPYLEDGGKSTASVAGTVDGWVRWTSGQTGFDLAATADVYHFFRENRDDLSGSVRLGGHTALSEHTNLQIGARYMTSRRSLQMLLNRTDAADVAPLPTVPLPDVTFGGQRIRLNQFGVDAALGTTVSARTSLSLAAGASALRVDSSGGDDSNTYSASAGLSHRLAERTALTANVSVSRFDYLGRRAGDGTTITPSVGLTQTLGPKLKLSASGGVSLSRQRQINGQMESFSSLYGQASLCSSSGRHSLCLNASRTAQATVVGGITAVTSVTFALDRQFGRWTSLSVNANYAQTKATLTQNRRFETYGASTTLSQQLGTPRISAFVSPSVTRYDNGLSGLKTNFQLQAGLRMSFGTKR